MEYGFRKPICVGFFLSEDRVLGSPAGEQDDGWKISSGAGHSGFPGPSWN